MSEHSALNDDLSKKQAELVREVVGCICAMINGTDPRVKVYSWDQDELAEKLAELALSIRRRE